MKGGGEVGVSLVGCVGSAVVCCALSRPVRNLPTIAGGACLLPSSLVMPSSIGLPGAGLSVGCVEGSSWNSAGIQSSGRAEHSCAWFLWEGLMMAEVQGEIMSFNSVRGLMMVSMRMDEVMLFTPWLVILMLKVVMLREPGLH